MKVHYNLLPRHSAIYRIKIDVFNICLIMVLLVTNSNNY